MPIQNTPPKDLRRAEKLAAFDRLLSIMDELRLNCPWDQKQTLSTIRPLTIEETYELSDAILKNDIQEIKNEIGDILLHLVFYSRIASEENHFDIADVIHGICDKMVRRHPHIYGETTVENDEDVKRNWEKIKLQEKKDKRVLEGVPDSLPAMTKAVRIQEKARGVGFDWDNKEDVWKKVNEELKEFQEAETLDEKNKEFGDVLFSLINYARFEKLDPEACLEKTNKKFISRFNYIEQKAIDNQQKIDELSLEEMDKYWEEAKKNEKNL